MPLLRLGAEMGRGKPDTGAGRKLTRLHCSQIFWGRFSFFTPRGMLCADKPWEAAERASAPTTTAHAGALSLGQNLPRQIVPLRRQHHALASVTQWLRGV